MLRPIVSAALLVGMLSGPMASLGGDDPYWMAWPTVDDSASARSFADPLPADGSAPAYGGYRFRPTPGLDAEADPRGADVPWTGGLDQNGARTPWDPETGYPGRHEGADWGGSDGRYRFRPLTERERQERDRQSDAWRPRGATSPAGRYPYPAAAPQSWPPAGRWPGPASVP